jgi:hypothetical protein
MTIVGLDIFILLALPIISSGRPDSALRPAVSFAPSPYVRAAYIEQLARDHADWLEGRMRAVQVNIAPTPELPAAEPQETRRLRAELARARARLDELEAAPAKNAESQSKLDSLQSERERLAEELAREHASLLKAARDTEALKEALAGLEQGKEQLAARAGELVTTVKERDAELARLQSEMESVRTELDKRLNAETGGHIAGLVEVARGRISLVTADMKVVVDAGGEEVELHAEGMAVPVALADHVALVAHASALGLTDEVFNRGEDSALVTLSRFSVAVQRGEAALDRVESLQFLREEPTLVVLVTERGVAPSTQALRSSSRRFLLDPTVIVAGAGDMHFEGRFTVRDRFVRLTAFRAMEFGARWISTRERSPGKPGDLVLDHEGNLVAILVTTTAGYILSPEERMEQEVVVASLRDADTEASASAARQLVSAALALNKWLHPLE